MSGVGEAVACQVGAKLGLMVDLEDGIEGKNVVFCFRDNKTDVRLSQTTLNQIHS